MIPNLHEDNQFFDCSRGKNSQSSPTDGSDPVILQFSVNFPLNWAAFDRHPLEMTFAVIKTVLLLLWLEEKMFHSLNAFVLSSLSTID